MSLEGNRSQLENGGLLAASRFIHFSRNLGAVLDENQLTVNRELECPRLLLKDCSGQSFVRGMRVAGLR